MDAQSETRVALPSEIITDDEHLDSTTSPIIVTIHRPQPTSIPMVHPLRPQTGERDSELDAKRERIIIRTHGVCKNRSQWQKTRHPAEKCGIPPAHAKLQSMPEQGDTAEKTREVSDTAETTHEVSDCRSDSRSVGYPKAAVNGRTRALPTAEMTREVSDTAETTREVPSNSTFDLP